MRTAAICPTCATYENALCILYNGLYLSNLDVAPLDSLEVILGKINDNLIPTSGTGPSIISGVYYGQQHFDTFDNKLYTAKTLGNGVNDWDLILKVPFVGAPEYANNADAIAGGLSIGKVYRTGDLLKIVH